MELRFSVLARNRRFSKAMDRIRPSFIPLQNEFAKIVLANPRHKAILVGITDDKGTDFFEEVHNDDEFFQVLAGCVMKEPDSELLKEIYSILYRAAITYQFSNSDLLSVNRVLSSCKDIIFDS